MSTKFPKIQEVYGGQTFNLGQKCLNPQCRKDISDQAHGNRLYCEDKLDDNGKKLFSCKSKAEVLKRLGRDGGYINAAKFLKSQTKRIESLIQNKGKRVTIDDLICYDININQSRERVVQNDHWVTYYFNSYKIEKMKDKFIISRNNKY